MSGALNSNWRRLCHRGSISCTKDRSYIRIIKFSRQSNRGESNDSCVIYLRTPSCLSLLHKTNYLTERDLTIPICSLAALTIGPPSSPASRNIREEEARKTFYTYRLNWRRRSCRRKFRDSIMKKEHIARWLLIL